MTGLPDILLAEDDAEDAELALSALSRCDLKERAYWVKDGQQALDYVRGENGYAQRRGQPPPRVVLLDLKMPRLTGLDVLRALKNDPASALVPVVIFTSSRARSDVEECWRLGANSYVVKPVDFNEFTETLCRVAVYWTHVNFCAWAFER